MKKKYILITLILLLAIYFLFPYLNEISQDKIPYPTITIGDTNISKDIEINSYASPIFFEGNEKAVLIIHGYLASPQEVQELAYYLNENGYTVFAPLMSGHGSDYKNLENVSWEDWKEESEYYYELLEDNYEEVHVVGFSLGSLSALELSMNYELDSLTVIGSPIFIFKEEQEFGDGTVTDELVFLQKRNEADEKWTGKRLGSEGAKKYLGLKTAFEGKELVNFKMELETFDQVFMLKEREDIAILNDEADLFHIVNTVKLKTANSTVNNYKLSAWQVSNSNRSWFDLLFLNFFVSLSWMSNSSCLLTIGISCQR